MSKRKIADNPFAGELTTTVRQCIPTGEVPSWAGGNAFIEKTNLSIYLKHDIAETFDRMAAVIKTRVPEQLRVFITANLLIELYLTALVRNPERNAKPNEILEKLVDEWVEHRTKEY